MPVIGQPTTIQANAQPVTIRRIGRKPISTTRQWEPLTAKHAIAVTSLPIIGVGSVLPVTTPPPGQTPNLITVRLVPLIAKPVTREISLPTTSVDSVRSATTPLPGAGHPSTTPSQ